METDGSRSSTENQRNEQNEHKTARVLLAPLIWLEKGLSALLKKALGANYADITEDEVMDLVDALAKDEEEGGIEEDSAQMINNIFEFAGLNAADVMTHRTAIVGVDVNKITLDDLIYTALDLGFSRIPAYDGTIDKIVGIIIVKDLLCLIGKQDLSDFKIEDFLRDVSFIPEACPCSEIFKTMNKLKAGMAVVVDEYGGMSGIITVTDLVEELVGDFDDDELEIPEPVFEKISENIWKIPGITPLSDVCEELGISLHFRRLRHRYAR